MVIGIPLPTGRNISPRTGTETQVVVHCQNASGSGSLLPVPAAQTVNMSSSLKP